MAFQDDSWIAYFIACKNRFSSGTMEIFATYIINSPKVDISSVWL